MIIKLEQIGERDIRTIKEILLSNKVDAKNMEDEVTKVEKFLFAAKNMENEVLGCIAIHISKEIWYKLCELRLLSAKNNDFETAKLILEQAEKIAIENGSKIMQVAITKGDKFREKAYKKSKFRKVNYFYNLGELVYVYQKNLTGKKD